jgi:hypothetical protein
VVPLASRLAPRLGSGPAHPPHLPRQLAWMHPPAVRSRDSVPRLISSAPSKLRLCLVHPHMMPTKTSAGASEVLRLGAMRLPPPLRTKWQSKAAIDAPPHQTDLPPSPINLLPHESSFHKGGRSPDAKADPQKKRRTTSGLRHQPAPLHGARSN